MTTTESTPVYYRIEAPGMGYCFNGTIIPNISNVVNLPKNLTGKSHTFPLKAFDNVPKGIYLKTSSDKVTVIGQSGGPHTTDTYFAIPIKNLCLDEYVYYPFSVETFVRADASVAIVGTEDETTITITASVNFKISFNWTTDWIDLGSGEKHLYVISKLQTVYLSAYIKDLSGSKIVANKPLSVISGHECAFVPAHTTACDHLIEQVLPTVLWGSVYYVAPLAGRKSYTLKIIAAHNDTKLQIICNGTERIFQLDEGEVLTKVYKKQKYCAIHSNESISVAQLSHGFTEDNMGDPMMTLIPSINDYSNRIISSTNREPTHTDYQHYVNIIVMPEYYQPNLIYLNAGSINQTLESYDWVPIKVNNTTEAYAAKIYLNVTEEIFQITHLNKAALMSAILYGAEGYGHPAGFNILQKYSST